MCIGLHDVFLYLFTKALNIYVENNGDDPKGKKQTRIAKCIKPLQRISFHR